MGTKHSLTFDSQISDLFFRRHILIQAIIILDFLRSLTAEARKKYAGISVPNKSVMYSDKIVSEEDVSGNVHLGAGENDSRISRTNGQRTSKEELTSTYWVEPTASMSTG